MQAQLQFDQVAAQQIDDPKQNDDSQHCFTMFYQSKHITRCLCNLIYARGFCHIRYLHQQWASLLNYELCAKHAHLYKSPWSHLHHPTAYGKWNRCHFTSEMFTTFVGSYPWSRPARSFPNMAPLLNHNQLSWQCHQKELNSSKTPKKTSVVWGYKLILLMVQNSQGQPPGMVQYLQKNNWNTLQTQICDGHNPPINLIEANFFIQLRVKANLGGTKISACNGDPAIFNELLVKSQTIRKDWNVEIKKVWKATNRVALCLALLASNLGCDKKIWLRSVLSTSWKVLCASCFHTEHHTIQTQKM